MSNKTNKRTRFFNLGVLLTNLSLCLAIWGASALAQTSLMVSREALFERAFKSLPFLMMMAGSDESFRRGLTEDEKEMYQYIDHLAQDARNRQWLLKNGIERFQNGEYDLFYYVAANYENSPKSFHTTVRFGLEFSNDPSLFRLRADEPERTAVTSADMNRNIFVNTRMINSPHTKIGLGDAVELLVHEFGHKIPSLGLPKKSSAIDSLAAKLKSYIDSKMTTFSTSKGKVAILAYKQTPYDDWLAQNFFGEYVAVNVPFKFEPLRVFDAEGIYVLYESESGTQDLTDELLRRIQETDIVHGNPDQHYSWRRLNWILASFVNVEEQDDNRIRVELNMNHLQMAVPFLKTGAPSPEQYKPYARAYKTTPPHVGVFLRKQWTLMPNSHSKLDLQHEAHLQVIYENPSIRANKIDQFWQGEDLVLRYRFSEMVNIDNQGIKANFRPFLIARFKGERIEIESTQKRSANLEYEFRYPGLKSRAQGTLQIVGIELGIVEPNLALSTEPRIKIYLPTSEIITLNGSNSQKAIKLVKVLGWNGQSWTPLESVDSKQELTHLRLVFDSTSALTSLKFLIDYDWIGLTYSRLIFPKSLPAEQTGQTSRPVSRWIEFSPTVFKQTFIGNRLFVDLPVDAGLQLVSESNESVDIPEEHRPAWMKGRGPISAIDEKMVFMAGLRRTILEIQAINQNLQHLSDYQERPLEFYAGRPVAKTPSITQCADFLKNPIGN